MLTFMKVLTPQRTNPFLSLLNPNFRDINYIQKLSCGWFKNQDMTTKFVHLIWLDIMYWWSTVRTLYENWKFFNVILSNTNPSSQRIHKLNCGWFKNKDMTLQICTFDVSGRHVLTKFCQNFLRNLKIF